jgi:hypothetical protein
MSLTILDHRNSSSPENYWRALAAAAVASTIVVGILTISNCQREEKYIEWINDTTCMAACMAACICTLRKNILFPMKSRGMK